MASVEKIDKAAAIKELKALAQAADGLSGYSTHAVPFIQNHLIPHLKKSGWTAPKDQKILNDIIDATGKACDELTRQNIALMVENEALKNATLSRGWRPMEEYDDWLKAQGPQKGPRHGVVLLHIRLGSGNNAMATAFKSAGQKWVLLGGSNVSGWEPVKWMELPSCDDQD